MEDLINPTHSMTVSEGAASGLGDVGDVPRATPTIGQSSAPGGDLDRHGTAYDAAKHEHRLRTNGAWALKRGNGARKASGKAYHVPSGSGPARPNETPTAQTTAPDSTVPQFAPGSHVAPPPMAEHEGILETEKILSESDYQSTGETLARGLFGTAQLMLDGKAWEPTPQESKAFASAFARVWFHYQLPRLGPLFELFFLIPPTIAKRADQPRTASLLGWMARWFKRGQRADPIEPEKETTPQRRGEVMNPNPTSRFRVVG